MLVDSKVLEFILTPKYFVDDILISLVTGFCSGYIIYILTVKIPEYRYKKPMIDEAMDKFSIVYMKNLYVLLLLCKNTAKDEKTWKKIVGIKDIDCFNDCYFNTMSHFSIMVEADTCYYNQNKKDGTISKLSWNDYLSRYYQGVYEDLEYIMMHYHVYLDNDQKKLINDLLNSNYIGLFVGRGFVNLIELTSNECNKVFYEQASLSAVYNQGGEFNNAFSGVNNDLLKSYVSILKSCGEYFEKNKIKYSLHNYNDTYALDKLNNSKVGTFGSAYKQ